MLLMTLATKPLTTLSVGATRVAAAGIAIVAGIAKAIVNRREVLRLTELDERGLKDLGLVRSDVEGALATSWLDDPSAILAARSTASARAADERRATGLRHAASAPAQAAPIATDTRVACSA